MKKLLVIVAGAVGYVLGTRAGRERYEQMRRAFNKVKNDPRVQQKAHDAADLAREQAPVVKDKVASVADSAATKVKGGGDPIGGSADPEAAKPKLNPDSTALQDDPFPKGDLP